MRRLLIAFAAIGITTVALLGPGRSLLPGSLRLQTPNGGLTATAADGGASHAGHEAASTPATRPNVVPPPGGARVDVATRRATAAQTGYVVETRIVGTDGKPVNDTVVRFYERVDFFGAREELIGTARTDGQGTATITYLPATVGIHQIVVRFPGQGSQAPSVGTASFEASVAAPRYSSDQPALLGFTRLVPYAAGAVLLAVWALIAFALFGTARGIAARADHITAKEDTA